ncbi:MAG: hypothetical protein QOI64_1599 [Solirubrobacteraceae bacterium]|nr:hypothetical protein [Solirubrobacteraceae bacterium]
MIRAQVQRLKRHVAPLVYSERPFAALCRINGPEVAGQLCARFIVPAGGSRPACLCIDRDVFGKDIDQLRLRTARSWPSVTQHLIYLFEQAWIPRPFFHQTAFQAQVPDIPASAVTRAERFALSFLRAARARHGVGAVLTGNVDYAPDEFIRRAAQRLGMPFLVLLKEHANSEYGHSVFSRSLAGYRYHGDGVAVFGPRTRTILGEQGVWPPERVRVTGPPRLDEWAGLPAAPQRDTAVLFSFSRDDQEGSTTFGEVLQAFIDAARAPEAAHLRFVVKCRDPYEQAVVAGLLPDGDAPVTLTADTPVADLLRRSVAAVGFSSLALTEALLSPAAVISPRFGTCRNDEDAQFDDRDTALAALAEFPRSPSELTAAMLRAGGRTVTAEDAEARRRYVHSLFCEPQPTYSALVDAFVGDALAGPSEVEHDPPAAAPAEQPDLAEDSRR